MATAPAVELRAFRFALDPTQAQREDLARHVGAARWAYNHALARKVEAHQAWRAEVDQLIATGVPIELARQQVRSGIPNRVRIQQDLNWIKGDSRKGVDGLCPWWHEVSTYAFQSAFTDCDRAWSNWLASRTGRRRGRLMGYPRFKKKGRSRDSVRIHHDVTKPTIRLSGYRRLIIPRIARDLRDRARPSGIRLHSTGKPLHRYLNRMGGHITSVTVSRSGDRWYAAVLVRTPAPSNTPIPTRRQRQSGTVGVDLGVNRLATLSTGLDTSYANPRHVARAQRRLTRAQQALARCQKNSRRRENVRRRIARLHHAVAEARAGALHQITKQLSTGYAVVALEDLNVAGLTRSARGTVDHPGRNVRAKSGLNRAILDAGFGEFRRQLTYKTTWYGSELRLAHRFYPSSKTCSTCGAVKSKLALSERTYRCEHCGTVIDRDVNAAKIIARVAVPQVIHVAADTAETANARHRAEHPARSDDPHREDPVVNRWATPPEKSDGAPSAR